MQLNYNVVPYVRYCNKRKIYLSLSKKYFYYKLYACQLNGTFLVPKHRPGWITREIVRDFRRYEFNQRCEIRGGLTHNELVFLKKSPYYQTLIAPISNLAPKPSVATSKKQIKVRPSAWKFERASADNSEKNLHKTYVKLPPNCSQKRLLAICHHLRVLMRKHPNYSFSIFKNMAMNVGMWPIKVVENVDERIFINREDPVLSFEFQNNLLLQHYVHLRKAYISQEQFEYCEPQMDIKKGSTPAGDVVKKHEKVGTSVVEVPDKPIKSVVKSRTHSKKNDKKSAHIVVESKNKYTDIQEKRYIFKQFQWNTTDSMNTVLLSVKVLQDILTNASMKKTQLVQPFKFYRYWKGEVHFHFQVTNNPFVYGSLQAAYEYLDDTCVEYYKHVFLQSASNHVLITAGASTDAILKVPFAATRSMIPLDMTGKMKEQWEPLNYALMELRVRNPLQAKSDCKQTVSVVVYVSIHNSEFTGLLPQEVTFNEGLLDALGNVGPAMQLLTQIGADFNRDMPPMQQSRLPTVPTSSNTFCLGTNVVLPVAPLRLDAKGQGTYTHGSDDEMLIKNICRTYGLIQIIEWSSTQAANTVLQSLEASPLLDYTFYKVKDVKSVGKAETRMLPPVAVMSSLFGYFSGGQEWRFDVICSQFHSGKLGVFFVPGPKLTSQNFDMTVFSGANLAVFDVSSSTSFTYASPYIANMVAWAKRYSGGRIEEDFVPPGYIYIVVINPLCMNCSVADKVYLNIYQRGAEDFELFAPTQPCLGLPFVRDIESDSSNYMWAAVGYYPYGAGTWESFYATATTTTVYPLIFRYGNGSDHIAQFPGLMKNFTKDDYVWVDIVDRGAKTVIDGRTFAGLWVKYIDYKGNSRTLKLSFGIPVLENSYVYLVPLTTSKDAQLLAKACPLGTSLASVALAMVTLGMSTLAKANDVSAVISTPANINVLWKINTDVAREIDYAFCEADDKPSSEKPKDKEEVVNVEKTNFAPVSRPNPPVQTLGQHLFGEKFMSVKDVLRRYTHYSTLESIINDDKIKRNQALFHVPIHPMGITLTKFTADLMRREGLRLLLAGFRFYVGGYRLKLIFERPGSYWVMHRFDDRPDSLVPELVGKPKALDDMIQRGYAMHYQVTTVNNIMEIEIPNYSPGVCNYISPFPSTKKHKNWTHSIGTLTIGVDTLFGPTTSSPIKVEIYGAVADDFACMHFQGFPSMMLLQSLTAPPAPPSSEEVEHQALLDYIIPKRVSTLLSVAGVTQTAVTRLSNVCDQFEQYMDDDDRIFKETCKHVFISLVSQIGHVACHPDSKSIAVAIATILCHSGLIIWEKFQDLVTATVSALNVTLLKPLLGANGECGEFVTPQAECESWAGFAGIIYFAISSAIGICGRMPSGMPGMFAKAVKCLGPAARDSIWILNFLKAIIEPIRTMWEYVLLQLKPSLIPPSIKLLDNELLSNMFSAYEKFMEPSERKFMLLDDTRRKDIQILYDYIVLLREYIAVNLGNRVELTRLVLLLTEMQHNLHDLIEECHSMKLDVAHCFESWCLWLCGDPGVGKSTLVSDMLPELLRDVGKPASRDSIFYCQVTQKYWNLYDQHPIIVVDDISNINNADIHTAFLDVLYSIKSRCDFNPPKAHLEDKKVRCSPYIFAALSNSDSINHWPSVSCAEAITRRWNLRIKVVWKPSFVVDMESKGLLIQSISDLPVGTRLDNVLEYYIITSAISNGTPGDLFNGPFVYSTLKKVIKDNFTAYYLKEIRKATVDYEERVRYMRQPSMLGANLTSFEDLDLDDIANHIRGSANQGALDKIRDTVNHYKKYMLELLSLKGEPTTHQSPPIMVDAAVGSDIPTYNCLPVRSLRLPKELVVKMKALPPLVDLLHTGQYIRDRENDLGEWWPFICNTTINFTGAQMHALMLQMINVWGADGVAKVKFEMRYAFREALIGPGRCMCSDESFEPEIGCISFIATEVPSGRLPTQLLLSKHCNLLKWKVLSGYATTEFTVKPVHSRAAMLRMQEELYGLMDGASMSMPTSLGPLSGLVVDSSIGYWYQQLKQISWMFITKTGSAIKGLAQYVTYDNFLNMGLFLSITYLIICMATLVYVIISGFYSFFTVENQAYAEDSNNRTGNGFISKIQRRIFKRAEDQDPEAIKDLAFIESKVVNLEDIKAERVQTQFGDQQFEQLCTRLEQNNIIITIKPDGQKLLHIRGLIVAERQMLTIRHYVDILQYYKCKCPDISVYITMGATAVITCRWDQFDFNDVNYFTNSNLTFLELPRNVPMRRSILGYMARESYHNSRRLDNSTLIEVVGRVHCYHGLNVEKYSYASSAMYSDTGEIISPETRNFGYRYMKQRPGLCGAILVHNNQIIGMHVAGNQAGSGYSEIIFREMLKPDLDNKIIQYEQVLLPVSNFDYFDPDSDILMVGEVPSDKAQHESGKSRLVKSVCFELFGVSTMEPNPLKRNDPRLPSGSDPKRDGCSKHGILTYQFAKQSLEKAKECLSDWLTIVKPVRQVGRLSLDESILGIDGLERYKRIQMNTSPGFPLVCSRPKTERGKAYLFDICEENKTVKLDPQLHLLLTFEENLRSRNYKCHTIFVDCLKDTKLPIEKCSIPGKTRIFSVSPVQYTIAFRQFYWDFVAAYEESFLKIGTGVGMAVQTFQWTELAQYLLEYGNNIICGDYTNFGPGLNTVVLSMAFDLIIDWYRPYVDDYHIQQMKILAEECICAYHLTGNIVYISLAGMPSGQPITVIINDLVNKLYMLCAWCDIMIPVGYSMNDFFKYIRIVTYGDDVIASIKDDVKELFNNVTLSEYFAQYNIKYTDESKSGNIVAFKTIAEATFLKRHFMPHPSRVDFYLARLPDAIIYETCYWVFQCKSIEEASLVNCQAAVELAYGQGPIFYKKFIMKLKEFWVQRNRQFLCDSWIELDNHYLM